MTYVPIPQQTGVFKDDTPLAAEGFFIDGDKIRFVRGKAQTVGGWEKASDTAFAGLCRGLNSWRDNNGLAYAGIGTHSGFYAYFDGVIYDITPIVSRGRLANPFSTVIATTEVTVAHTAHGRAVGDRVNFDNATPVGGLTIDGDYTVATVVDANTYTITAASAATSSAGPGGGTVDYAYYLATGLMDSLGGAGYGTGGWGVGTYGGSSTTVYYARTWSQDNWGQNLLANPRGGGLYEWSPMFTQTELVTAGDFASSAPWSYGTGWSWTGSAAAGTGPSAGDLSQAIVLTGAAWNILEFDLTRTAGTLQPKLGTTALGGALSASAHIKQVFFTGTGNLILSKDAAFSGSVDNVSVKQLINLNIVTNAPAQNTCMVVTPERIVMVGGTIDSQTNLFNPLHVRWSDQDYNLAQGLPGNQIWTATATNQAGFYTLAQGGRIVGMRNGTGEVLIWTDDGLYAARYVPDPNIVYSFRLVGVGCGLIGPNAVAVLGGIAYWMSPAGEFYRYAGGAPEPLQSTIRRDVFDHLAQVQGDKVYAFANAAFGEVWWLYPDARDGNECSRYALYDVAQNVWAPGTFDRTAWLDAGPLPYPVAASSTGAFYFQEKGDSADGAAFSWRLTTGAINIGDGHTLFQVNGFIPDFEDLQGGLTVGFNSYLYPTLAPVTHGPYGVTASSAKVDLIAIAREATLDFTGNAAPAFMRLGALRMDIFDTGQLY